jgi:hypothetical protein
MAKKKKERTVAEEVQAVLDARDKERVIYFPVKHFSPTCAWHLDRLIRQVQPVGVLVEGPDDATDLIQWIVHPDTKPPFTIFSSYTDRKNVFELNGVLSPSPEVPARYRGWWPMTEYCPEYIALRTGHEVGAELAFIDAPLGATILTHHVPNKEANQVVNDRHLATNAYFEALRRKQRRRSFEEFWQANFETGGFGTDTEAFMRTVLTFAWCSRHVSGDEKALEADGTLLRELHMKDHITKFLKTHTEGLVVVVTGAFHSVALPSSKKKSAKILAKKNDLKTMLTGHSFHALDKLYDLDKMPNYGQVVWEQIQAGHKEPFNTASMQLLIEIMRRARDANEGVSTADAVGAYTVARNLAILRLDHEVTLADILDAIQMGYVKGDKTVAGVGVERATREVLVGSNLGRVTGEAGQAPLFRDYYETCRAHKLEISGKPTEVKCDTRRYEKHRLKSAFLHQCYFCDIPFFGTIKESSGGYYGSYKPATHYKGPDIVSGEGMERIQEIWAIKWRVKIDDRLLELSDRGASLAQVAGSLIQDQLVKARGSASETTQLLLRSAQMMLLEMFDELLGEVEDAVVLDSAFESLVTALSDFVLLYTYRDTLATEGHERLLKTVVTLFNKAAMILPAIANAEGTAIKTVLDRLQTLVRITLTFEGTPLDRDLLIERIHEMVADPDGEPSLRGAGYGILFSFGSTREKVVARELSGYLRGSPERVLAAGRFLDGLFSTSKNIFMGSQRLVRAINEVLGELDWETFKLLLPDMRRAFAQFIPTEIDKISEKVSEEIGLDEAPSTDEPVPEALAQVGINADLRVQALLGGWI